MHDAKPPLLKSSHAINSTALGAAAYDDTRAVLQVEFRDGTVYQYLGVPKETYQVLCEAESKGLHFNRQIRNRFPCIKLAQGTLPC